MAEAPTAPEAWLAGPLPGIDPLLMPAAHALVQARLDLARAAAGLTAEELWLRIGGTASIGFHLRHLAASTDRLLTYARGMALSEEQRQTLATEKAETGPDVETLLRSVATAIDAALAQLRETPRESLLEERRVGRAGRPSTVLGLLFHAGEHAARHAGQVVTTAKLVRAR
jgi:uncharacterized damage-inducible protein DinB